MSQKTKPQDFLNFEIGEIQPKNKAFIPAGNEIEYAPQGASLEEINKRRDTLRDYYKRNNQISIIADYAGGGDRTIYTCPANYDFYIDTIQISGVSDMSAAAKVFSYILRGTDTFYLANLYLVARLLTDNVCNSCSTTFNNAIKVNSSEEVHIDLDNGCYASVVITGWLEDKPM